MFDAPLAAAFTAGMIATVNPCGFVMLPAYVSFFLGIEGDERNDASIGRAIVVSLTVAAGFLTVFGLLGILLDAAARATTAEVSPWLTVVIGVALSIGGIAFLAGWEPKLALPRLDKGGRTREIGSMYVFGISYAIASFSCTIGPFAVVVAETFSRTSTASGIAAFLAYGLGMALLLMVVTVALALARQGIITKLRQAMPYVMRIAGAVMLLAGAYLAWYGVYEIRLIQRGEQNLTRGPVGTVTGWSSDASNWLAGFDPLQVVLVCGMVIGVFALIALLRTPPAAPSGGSAPSVPGTPGDSGAEAAPVEPTPAEAVATEAAASDDGQPEALKAPGG